VVAARGRGGLRALLAGALLLAAAAEPGPPALLGFTAESSARQRAVEARLLALPDPARCEVHHRELTRTPHTAGTDGALRVVEYVAARFREYGLETEVVPYDVLLAWPRAVEVELLAPHAARLATREDVLPEDPATGDPTASGPWHAYAKSGEVAADVVYANYGRAEDYDELARLGIEVRGRIALARHFKGYRGGKSLEAERRGVAVLLTYSDPAEDGYVQGDVYPNGPWGPDSHVQRGGNVYDFIVPGDALTPGWASVPGARRIAESESEILPKIPSVPLSFRDARVILEALGGPVRPSRDWQGGGPFAYHVGPGPARLRVKVDVPRETRTIRNVIGRIRGGDPDPRIAEQVVLLSNHHDAWTFGGVDPSSGTATTLDLARALGQLVREGMRPRRTLVFGVWDAEEFTLTGSTEWGEQHGEELARTAVACLNVDASTSGDRLSVSAVPSLRPFLYEAARSVADPRGRGTVYDVWRAGAGENVRAYGVLAGARTEDPAVAILGSGSDYTVFFNHIGVPSVDMVFDGPYGVYHSIYDTHEWMRRHGDPGFLYHAAMARLWGLMALRLANADVLPFDYGVYGRDLLSYLDDVSALARQRAVALDVAAARAAAEELAALRMPAAGGPDERVAVNAGLMAAERALLTPDGIPGRPWFRHLVYAPLPTYQAETLPGVREAILAGDQARARAQLEVLAAALRRARAAVAGARGVTP
jgi:N-acetylated-alpha-linked acidic dipeptidase